MKTSLIYYMVCLIAYQSFVITNTKAQTPVKFYDRNCIDSSYYATYSNNKVIPSEMNKQALIALSCYPELENVQIVFRFREKVTPLSSRPKVFSALRKAANRTYVINISTKSIITVSPILFSNLPFNAQIGVLGHELAHIADYNSKNTSQLILLAFKMFNRTFVDRFEFNTDSSCINHGLGYQLYDWSKYVRTALGIKEWKGAEANYSLENDIPYNQRYMNPETIEKYIASNTIYQGLK